MKKETKILYVNSLKTGYITGSVRTEIFSGMNCCAYAGELIAIIGRNGTGKSTLLRTLAGLQPALGGNILYDGKSIDEFHGSELAKIAGYISTETIKVNNMTVYDLISLGRFPYTNWLGLTGVEDMEKIYSAMEKTSTLPFRNRFIAELSDGERQKVMIARLIAQDTKVMLMDEPTAFLDTGSKFEVMHLLHQLAHKAGKTIIFSTHDLSMAINHSDKIWLFADGKMKEGAPEDLMIEGSFEHLFDSSLVTFNSANGTYSFKEEKTGSVFLSGKGLPEHWTKEALRRSGIGISDVETIPYIRILPENENRWQLVYPDYSEEYTTIYDLIRNLPSEI